MTGYNTHQYETSKLHETRTIATTPPPAGRSIHSSPTYFDGIGADEYIEWESKIDNFFAQCCMCERRKIKNASSVLRHLALTWWDSLNFSVKPHTWNDMKNLMRENFVNPSLVINSNDEVHQLEQSLVIPPAMPNLLQDNVQKSEDDVIENEMLTTSCGNSEPSPITLVEHESKGNAHDAKLTEGESCLNVLNFSTNHAIIEQKLVEPSLYLPLSQDVLLDVPCYKDDLHDHIGVIPMQPLMNNHAICMFEPNTYVENKHLLPISAEKNELKLLSSLNTLGYIEFDTLCALSTLEEKFKCAELPWLSRCTYHFIGKYNYKESIWSTEFIFVQI